MCVPTSLPILPPPQEKLRILKRYVGELRESYDDLMRDFTQLQGAAKTKVGQLQQRLTDTITEAKVSWLVGEQDCYCYMYVGADVWIGLLLIY